MTSKKIVVSGVNMVEGGIFTILHNFLHELSNFNSNGQFEIIALVHDSSKLPFKNVSFIEFPKSKKSWLYRLYYEYIYFNKLSKQLQPDIWISLHDTTPIVVAKKQFVYCHHPTTFFKPTWKDWKFDYKIGLFNLLYDFLFKINIKKNHTVFVQQHWIKDEFEKRFNINNCKVAYPKFIEEITTQNYPFEKGKIHFLYPSFPRSFKNHDLICEAIQLLPFEIQNKIKVHFTTIKGSNENYAKFLIKNYSHLKALVFHEKVSRGTLLKMYHAMDGLIFPSKVETWGLPITEAKAYNKPLFLANLPYAKETCGNYEKVSFFDITNPVELSKFIHDFVLETIEYQGNSVNFETTNVLHNWDEFLDYILKK